MRKRAYTLQDIMKSNYSTIPWGGAWKKAFTCPQDTGVWFVWGQSGNGKTSFIVQLLFELSNYYPIFFSTLEEGIGLTLQEKLKTNIGLGGQTQKLLFDVEGIPELDQRLSKRRAPHVAVIDSAQQLYTTPRRFNEFRMKHRDKLIIVISQSNGSIPRGKTADAIRSIADLKIWVEGYKAISNGRYNPGGEFVIWKEGAAKYWGKKQEKQNNPTS